MCGRFAAACRGADGARGRGDRGKRHGDEGYAGEELCAELGSAFLCADLGIAPEVRPDHAADIAGWLTVLKGDKRFILTAASHAQRAVDYLHGLQPQASAGYGEQERATA